MMRYLLLAYRDAKWWESISVSERAAFEEACRASEQDLTHSLHLMAVRNLRDNSALTVRIVNGEVLLTDGSVLRSQEQLVQLLFVQAVDLNAALQIASRLPHVRGGPIEVRTLVR